MLKIKLIACVFILMGMGLHAQQNFINVPSSEITKKGRVFFQQQFNFNEIFQANSTLDIGLGKGFEAGVNLLGLNYNQKGKSFFKNDTNDRDPYNPLLAFNVQKQFLLTEKSSLNFGGQLGVNIHLHNNKHEAGLFYMNYALRDFFGNGSHFVFGSYFNSRHYGGTGNRIGVWTGAQIPVTKKLHAMAESVIGTNAIAYTTIAGIYYVKKWLPITLGVQIPNTSRNAYSVVIEFTFVPQ